MVDILQAFQLNQRSYRQDKPEKKRPKPNQPQCAGHRGSPWVLRAHVEPARPHKAHSRKDQDKYRFAYPANLAGFFKQLIAGADYQTSDIKTQEDKEFGFHIATLSGR